MRTPRLITVALLSVLLAGAEMIFYTSSWAGSYAPIGGLYALGRVDEKILENRNVDGVTLRFWWDKIEPSEGQFNWTAVDRDIARVRAHGKKVSITVAAGYGTPAWVYAAGAAPFKFS